MIGHQKLSSTFEQAQSLLGVASDATDEELRLAYLEQVRRHPPDQDPEQFEKIRDAYEQLRSPRLRAQQVLAAGPDPLAPLASLLEGVPRQRRFVGPQLWMDAMKENRT